MKLATIEKILALDPIEGADRIEVASVLGYRVVTQKGIHKVGDLVVFVVPDTTVPRASWSEFLFKGDQAEKERIRLKAIRLRGQVSQGLLVPLYAVADYAEVKEGDDATDFLGVEKFEKPIPACLSGDVYGYMPGYLRKTDEDNLRSNLGALAELQGKKVYITQKVDGSSGTFFWKDGEFGVCSRKLHLKESDSNSFWKIARQEAIESHMRDRGLNISIQGEVFGEGIQGNKLDAKGVEFKVFDVWDIDKQEYYNYEKLCNLCEAFNLRMVDVVFTGDMNLPLGELVKFANEQVYDNNKPAEGIVIRPVETTQSQSLGRRLSVKIISEKFAVKHGE
jgi:RNA ligase (TIGR02306 family)